MSADDIKDRLVGGFVSWMRYAPAARKFLDILVLGLACTVGISLYAFYSRQDTVLGLLNQALTRYPEVSIAKIESGFAAAWEDAKSYGAVAAEVWVVDVTDNSRTLLRYETADKKIEEYIVSHKRRPLLSSGPDSMRIEVAASILTGDPVIDDRSAVLEGYRGLFIPVPDEPGELLAGVLIYSFPVSVPEAEIGKLRTAILPWTKSLTK